MQAVRPRVKVLENYRVGYQQVSAFAAILRKQFHERIRTLEELTAEPQFRELFSLTASPLCFFSQHPTHCFTVTMAKLLPDKEVCNFLNLTSFLQRPLSLVLKAVLDALTRLLDLVEPRVRLSDLCYVYNGVPLTWRKT